MESFCQDIDEIFDNKCFNLMTAEEIGCYFRMKSYCGRYGSMPAERKRLAVICNSDEQTIIGTLEQACNFFKMKNDDSNELFHTDIEDERQKRINTSNAKRIYGKKGAEVRWAKNKNENK